MRIDVDGSAETDNIFEQLLYSTIQIECIDSKGIHLCMGTGFFLHRQVGPGAYKIFLVTNRHVLDRDVDSISLVFTKTKDGEPLVGQCEHYMIERIGPMVMHQNVDLAVLDCSALFARFPEDLYFKAFSYEMLSTFEAQEFSLADSVYFIGYPEGIYDTYNGLPLLRKGIISSHPDYDFDGMPQFVIDANVYHGSSGSPVFINDSQNSYAPSTSPTIKLLGIVTAAYFKGENALSLGIVIKSTCIKKLIDEICGPCM